ncbi:MAG: ROK family protein, partial [Burkholderiales bacterium]
IVMMTLGTGIGGATMIQGRLLRGAHSQAGCLGGHFSVNLRGRLCHCGNIGCAESEAAGWSLPIIAREWEGFAQSALADRNSLDFKVLFEVANQGDSIAQQIQQHCLLVWAANTVAQIHAYDPEVVVLGGGVMNNAEQTLPFVQEHVAQHAWTPWGKVQVRKAAMGNHAAFLGAIPLLQEKVSATTVELR